jgi:hypothetical protein
VDSLVDLAESARFPIEYEPARTLFLAELAFDDLNCSATCAGKIADRTFLEIETGTWPPLREQLLDRSFDGLFSDSLKKDVQTKIQKWFPERFAYRWSVYKAMALWPRESDIFYIAKQNNGQMNDGGHKYQSPLDPVPAARIPD